MSARAWQPGEEGVLPVRFEYRAGDGAAVSYVGFGMGDRRTTVMVEAADLLPVPQADEGTIERAAEVLYGVRDDPYGDEEWNELTSAEREQWICYARALAAANLLTSPVQPGRSEAEAVEWGTRWTDSTGHVNTSPSRSREAAEETVRWSRGVAVGYGEHVVRRHVGPWVRVADTTDTEGGK